MNAFIEKNDRFLRLCCNVARFVGLLLLGLLLLVMCLIPFKGIFPKDQSTSYLLTLLYFAKLVQILVFPALLLLGIEQLIKCVIAPDFKPNWILRFADKLIYLFVGFLIIQAVISNMYAQDVVGLKLSMMLMSLAPVFVKVLVWLGLGLLLKRVVPIIRESQTLV